MSRTDTETWIVLTDEHGRLTGAGRRHIKGSHGRPDCGSRQGTYYRDLADHELDYFLACGRCIPAEHDGPFESALEAASKIRGAAAAVGLASLDLNELGYGRVARALKVVSDHLFASANRAEPDEGEGP